MHFCITGKAVPLLKSFPFASVFHIWSLFFVICCSHLSFICCLGMAELRDCGISSVCACIFFFFFFFYYYYYFHLYFCGPVKPKIAIFEFILINSVIDLDSLFWKISTPFGIAK